MAHIPELMAAGVPARLARMLGANRLRTVTAQGSSQDDATPLITNFCLVACDDAGAGIRLGQASGAALTALYSIGPEDCLVYPAEDEAFNDEAPNEPLTLAGGFTWLAVPAADRWIVIIASGAGAVPPDPPAPAPQYAAPADGATVAMLGADSSAGLILEPAAMLNALTVVLPPAPRDGDIARGSTTEGIMALGFDGGVNAVQGAPVFVAAGTAWAFVYRAANSTWYIWT